MSQERTPQFTKYFSTGDPMTSDDPRSAREKADEFKVQQLASGHTTYTREWSEHSVQVDVF